jgi:predicted DNA-binding transcriptional regulator AlpA
MTAQVKVINHNDAAAMIGVTPATLRFWRCKGKGPRFIKLGESKQSGVCYDPADIEAWKAARKFASTSAATVSHPGNA